MLETPQPQAGPTARRPVLLAAVSLIAAAALAACKPLAGDAAAATAAATSSAPSIPVAEVVQLPVDDSVTVIARVEAAQRVELRPRVAGHIESIHFREGDLVEAGQVLFRVDPRTYDAAVARARAEVQLARAREQQTRNEHLRARQLASDLALSAEEVERRHAAHAEAEARLAAAEANLQAASLDREYAIVRSPIRGRIGRALVTPGNFVTAGAAQSPLAHVLSVAPLHVHFDVADPEVLARLSADRRVGRWKVRVLDPQTQRELVRAPLDFVDNEVLGSTGTLRLRARVDTPVAQLVPGSFVRVQLAHGGEHASLVVPDKAIGTDQGQRYVLVVGEDGEVSYRAVQAGRQHGALRAVTAGLRAGEKVVVSGLMRVRPGMKVQPVLQNLTEGGLAQQPGVAGAGKS